MKLGGREHEARNLVDSHTNHGGYPSRSISDVCVPNGWECMLMCEINPKHTLIMRLEFFTSAPDMTREEFTQIVTEKCFNMEMKANEDMRIRCHIHGPYTSR